MKIKKFTILMTAFAIICLSGQLAFAAAPVANDDNGITNEDTPVGIDVLANDTAAFCPLSFILQ